MTMIGKSLRIFIRYPKSHSVTIQKETLTSYRNAVFLKMEVKASNFSNAYNKWKKEKYENNNKYKRETRCCRKW